MGRSLAEQTEPPERRRSRSSVVSTGRGFAAARILASEVVPHWGRERIPQSTQRR